MDTSKLSRVLKWGINPGLNVVKLAASARIVSAAIQSTRPYIWVLTPMVETGTVDHTLLLVSTGVPVSSSHSFIMTIHGEDPNGKPVVLHLFEDLSMGVAPLGMAIA